MNMNMPVAAFTLKQKSLTPLTAGLMSIAGATLTSPSLNLGSPGSLARTVVAGVYFYVGGGGANITSATIGGIAATVQVTAINGNLRLAIISAVVPTGTAATVIVNLSLTGAAEAYYVSYLLTGYGANYAGNFNTSGVTWVESMTMNTPLNGCVIVAYLPVIPSGSITSCSFGVPLTKDLDFQFSSLSGRISGASAVNTPLAAGASFSANAAGGAGSPQSLICGTSWN